MFRISCQLVALIISLSDIYEHRIVMGSSPNMTKNQGFRFFHSVVNHFTNFIECVRSNRWQDLHADILQGHLSTSLCHLGNIACRVKRSLQFDPDNETFIGDVEANACQPSASHILQDLKIHFNFS